MPIEARLGDLRGAGEVPEAVRGRVELRPSADAEAQARAVCDSVRVALDAGAPVEEVAIAVPRMNEETWLVPIRPRPGRGGPPSHAPREESPSSSGVVALALGALSIAERGLARREVTSLLRSRYIEASRVASGTEEEALAALSDLAEALDSTATVAGAELGPGAGGDVARGSDPEGPRGRPWPGGFGAILMRATDARTRAEHVAAARVDLAGPRDRSDAQPRARATLAGDEGPRGLARAELQAFARDARAWARGRGARRVRRGGGASLGLASATISAHTFRHELHARARHGAPLARRRARRRRSGLRRALIELAGGRSSRSWSSSTRTKASSRRPSRE